MILILKAYQDLCVEACVTHFWESKLLPREDFCSRVCLKKNRLSLLMVERIPRQNKLQYLIIYQSSSVPLKKYFNIWEKKLQKLQNNNFFFHTDSIEPDVGAYLQTSSYPVFYYFLAKIHVFFRVEDKIIIH